jgi:hypothetical protein
MLPYGHARITEGADGGVPGLESGNKKFPKKLQIPFNRYKIGS